MSPTTAYLGEVELMVTFADPTKVTTTRDFFSVDDDYFGLVDPLNLGDSFFGGAVSSGIPAFTGFDGTFLVGNDLDGRGEQGPVYVDIGRLLIQDTRFVTFSGMFAASNGRNYDATDYLQVCDSV